MAALCPIRDSPRASDDCLVSAIKAATKAHSKACAAAGEKRPRHDNPLWPQSFYLAPTTHVVCYDPELYHSRVVSVLSELTGCASVVAAEVRVNDRGVYAEAVAGAVTWAVTRAVTSMGGVCAEVERLYPRDALVWRGLCGGCAGRECGGSGREMGDRFP